MKKTKSEIKKYLMKLAKDRNEKELIEIIKISSNFFIYSIKFMS